MERPPENLARLLWPNEWEGASPHITEMGWTVVPPNSSPQQVHADIVSNSPCGSVHRERWSNMSTVHSVLVNGLPAPHEKQWCMFVMTAVWHSAVLADGVLAGGVAAGV